AAEPAAELTELTEVRGTGYRLQVTAIVIGRAERMNSPQRTHEGRLRGLSVTGECHAGTGAEAE
ncbi:MAG TPA: hypothetical protein VLK84_09005, partial [Longimicrobium sp.]|nr:hypothetical protein [Longimicrobium sp.]